MSSTHAKPVIVRHVWADNLIHEFSLIRMAIIDYSYVSFDTEFPGTVFEPDDFKKNYILRDNPDYVYFLMKENVNRLKLVQLGVSLSDSDGNLPSFGTQFCYIWEFNFNDFDLERDLRNAESVQFLEKHGIDFKKNSEKGIDSKDFASLLRGSGLVMNGTSFFKWITFHGSYDLGFLIKILVGGNLPDNLQSFKRQVHRYMGARVYDLKYMTKTVPELKHGGLETVANLLGVAIITGNSHQAGSDSLLTLQAFIKFKDLFANNSPSLISDFNGFEGLLFGLSPRLLTCGSQFMYSSCNRQVTTPNIGVVMVMAP